MITHFHPDLLEYTGEQLHSHFAYKKFALLGDSIVSFIGPCRVEKERLVDLEDQRREEKIYSPRMLHFIVETFDRDLAKAVLLQRLLVVVVEEVLKAELGVQGLRLRRSGDDLFDGGHKLSVSIATVSPVSSLIHFALNVSAKGTPVPAKGLEEYGEVDIPGLAKKVMASFVSEMESVEKARLKVRAVP